MAERERIVTDDGSNKVATRRAELTNERAVWETGKEGREVARGQFPQPGKTAGPWIQSADYVIDLRTQHHHHHQILFAKPRANRHNAAAFKLGGLVLIY